MNERIRQLAKKSGFSLDSTGIYTAKLEHLPITENMEKFAELLIKECISVPYDMWDKAELNADIAVKIEHRIKEHFGVEQ